MNCQEVVELMQRFLDQDLNETEHEAMMAHLSRCPECADMFARLQQLSHELASLPKVTPPTSLVDSILPRLEEIDRLKEANAAEAQMGAAGSREAAPKRTGWIGRLRSSFAVTGGVVAAGVLIAIFAANSDGTEMKHADQRSLAKNEISGGLMNSGASQEKAMKPDNAVQDSVKLNSAAANDQSGKKENASASDTKAPAASQDRSTLQSKRVGSPAAAAPGTNKEPENSAENEKNASGGVSVSEPRRPESEDKNSDVTTSAAAGTGQAAQAQPPSEGNGTAEEKAAAPTNPDANPIADQDKHIEAIPPSGQVTDGAVAKKSVQPDGNSRYGIAVAAPVHRLPSPDNSYVAVFDPNSRKVAVLKASDEKEAVFTSERQWADTDLVELKEWSSGTKLAYTVTDKDHAKKTFVIDLETKQEVQAAL